MNQVYNNLEKIIGLILNEKILGERNWPSQYPSIHKVFKVQIFFPLNFLEKFSVSYNPEKRKDFFWRKNFSKSLLPRCKKLCMSCFSKTPDVTYCIRKIQKFGRCGFKKRRLSKKHRSSYVPDNKDVKKTLKKAPSRGLIESI